ncbi:hypothetical protein D3C72_855370 [compost metagenome]
MEEINHHHSERQVATAIFARHFQYLLLGAVAQFALPQAADKGRGRRRSAGGGDILAGDLRDAVACGDPVVHLPRDAGAPFGLVFGKADFPNRRIIPQHAVAQIRLHKRHAGLRVALGQFEGTAFQIQPGLLILTHTVNPLLRARFKAHGELILAARQRFEFATVEFQGADIFILALFAGSNPHR